MSRISREKEASTNVAQRLMDLGFVVSGVPVNVLANEINRMIHEDYIPGGESVVRVTNVRSASAGYRCCFPTGDDIQSGPIYCGAPASLMATAGVGKGVYACPRHADALRHIEKLEKSSIFC